MGWRGTVVRVWELLLNKIHPNVFQMGERVSVRVAVLEPEDNVKTMLMYFFFTTFIVKHNNRKVKGHV